MDAARRHRFLAYFSGLPFKGERSKLISKTGFTKGRVAQYFDEAQPFGERAARSLAGRLGLPLDFFESDQGVTPRSADDAETAIATLGVALRDIRDLDPVNFEALAANIQALLASMRQTNAILSGQKTRIGAPDRRAHPRGVSLFSELDAISERSKKSMAAARHEQRVSAPPRQPANRR